MLRRKSFKILCTISAVLIAFFSFCISASAATTSIPFENVTIEEAVIYSCEDNGTLLQRIGSLQTMRDDVHTGYCSLYYPLYSASVPTHPPFVTTVLGANLNPNTDTYSVSIDILYPYPIYISWAAIQTDSGEAVRATMEPLYATDINQSVAVSLYPNSDTSVFGYRFSWPARKDYNDYIMFHLVSMCDNRYSDNMVYNLYADFNFEFYYSAPDGSAIGDLKDSEDAVLNSDVKILTGYDSYGNPIYSDGSLSDLSNNFIDDLQSNVKSLLLTSRTSLMAAGNFLSKLFGISGINGLLFLSLAFGIVPLIVGLGVYAMRSFDRANYRAEIKRERLERYEFYKNRRGK